METQTADWLPIETAPKDGTLIRVKKGEWEATGLWRVNAWCSPSNMKFMKVAFNDEHQPTHWRPMTVEDTTKDRHEWSEMRAAALVKMGTGRIRS